MIATGHLRQIKTKKGNGFKINTETPRGADGKRHRQSVTFYGTRKQAEHKLREILSDIENGIAQNKPSEITVEQWMKKWLSVFIENIKSPSTTVGYKGNVKTHIVPLLGSIYMKNLTNIEVQDFVNKLYSTPIKKGSKRSNKTVKKYFSILKPLAIKQ